MIGGNMNWDETGLDTHGQTTSCFNCGSTSISKVWKNQRFQYGNGESAVELNADMPVHSCEECGSEFAGAEAEELRHEAVCRHLGVLAPREIVAIRESIGMSRGQFAECTGIGIASLKRWETGNLVQNLANDELMYLMIFPENVKRLQRRDRFAPLDLRELSTEMGSSHRSRCAASFRGRCIEPNGEIIELAQTWALRA